MKKLLAASITATLILTIGLTGYALRPKTVIVESAPIAVRSSGGTTLGHDQPTTTESQALLDLTNVDRAQNNLPPLSYDARLEQSAQKKCNDMLQRHYFAHDGGQGVYYFFPQNWEMAGENLARDFNTPQAIEQAWLNSPTHRANVLGHYDSVGFAECGDMVVEHFVLWPDKLKGE